MARHRMLFLAAAAVLLAHQASAQDAQVMHWWTSRGDVNRLTGQGDPGRVQAD